MYQNTSGNQIFNLYFLYNSFLTNSKHIFGVLKTYKQISKQLRSTKYKIRTWPYQIYMLKGEKDHKQPFAFAG